MAKKTPIELLKKLRIHLDELSEGGGSASEVAATLNEWARESAENIKVRVHEEVEEAVLRMGFIKRDEYEKLAERVAKLEAAAQIKPASRKRVSTPKKPLKSSKKATAAQKAER